MHFTGHHVRTGKTSVSNPSLEPHLQDREVVVQHRPTRSARGCAGAARPSPRRGSSPRSPPTCPHELRERPVAAVGLVDLVRPVAVQVQPRPRRGSPARPSRTPATASCRSSAPASRVVPARPPRRGTGAPPGARRRTTSTSGSGRGRPPYQMVKNFSPCFSHGNASLSPNSTCPGSLKSAFGRRPGPQHVQDRHPEQGRRQPVAGHVEQVQRQVVRVEPVVAERVAAQLGRRDVPPVQRDRPRLGPAATAT